MKKPELKMDKKANRSPKILIACIKYYQAIWFFILVVAFSMFVFSAFSLEISFDTLNVKNILFCTWILLIFIPFVKSIDIAGIIKLVTREDDKTVEKLKEAKEAIVTNVNLNVTNSNVQQSSDSTFVPESNPYPYSDEEGEQNVL